MVCITGASKGIGESLARTYASLGNDLLLIARTKEKLEKLKIELEAQYEIHVNYLCIDLSTPKEEWISLLAPFIAQIDILICNAGFGLSGEFLSHDIQKEEAMVEVNIKSILSIVHLVGGSMKERRKGSIGLISSVGSMIPGPFMSSYYASKAYLSSFGMSLSYELKPNHVYVTTCNLPRIDTEFDQTAGERHSKYIKKGKPIGYAAKKIYRAIQKKKKLVNIGFGTKMTNLGSRLLPRRSLARFMKKVNE